MLVPAAKQDEIVGLLVETAKTFTVGDPTDEATVIGPVVSESARTSPTDLCRPARITAQRLRRTDRRPGQARRRGHRRRRRATATPPRRLLLGSDAWTAVHASLSARLQEVEAQRETASVTDTP